MPIFAMGILNGLWLEDLHARDSLLFWVSDAFNYLALPIIAITLLGKVVGVWPSHYGFTSFNRFLLPFEKLAIFTIVVFVFWLSFDIFNQIAYKFLWQWQGSSWWYSNALPAAGASRLLTIIYLSATAAFVEEAVFRGIPWLYFSLDESKTKSLDLFVLSTSLAFGATHWEQGLHMVVSTFMLGVVLALMYAKVRNMWPFVLGHFVTDIVALI